MWCVTPVEVPELWGRSDRAEGQGLGTQQPPCCFSPCASTSPVPSVQWAQRAQVAGGGQDFAAVTLLGHHLQGKDVSPM